jgi:signal transduction histidine kinase
MTSEQLTLLVETVQKLSLARDLNKVMEVVRTAARKLTGADGATFVLRDRDLCYYADEDAIEPLWKGQRFPMSACISGWAMLNKQPAVIADIYLDSRIPIDAYRPTFVKSLAMVPIRTLEPIGAIGNYWAKQHTPTTEEVLLLQSLADITSVSIENIYVYNELEERVKQRTEQLEAANNDLEAFSYSVSHDLRAPLRAIKGFTQILKEDYSGQLDEEGKRILDNVNYNTVKMSTLIDDLLEFAKLGRKDVNRTQIDMNELTSAVLADINKAGNCQATFIIQKKLHPVFADYGLMTQVMVNLLSNAIKYSSKIEKPVVEVSSYEQDGDVIFSVKDNGAGFNMEYANKLFRVFQRLHTQSEFEGTGVGLSLVYRIIKKHGGRIWAEAKVNEGATFKFGLKNELPS